MAYQKIINLLDDAANQPFTFRTRNLVETNDKSRGSYNANIDTQLNTSMIRSHLCKYSDAYIHVKAAITILNTAADATPVNDTNKKVISKN